MAAVMRESLRLGPSVPGRMIESLKDQTLKNGKYAVAKGEILVVCNFIAQRDPKVFGDDVSPFKHAPRVAQC